MDDVTEPYSDLDAIERLEEARKDIKRLTKARSGYYNLPYFDEADLARAVATYKACLRYLLAEENTPATSE